MGKPSRERSLSDKEARAIAKNLRVSPQKLNLVAGLIRGKKVDRALADLEFSRKRIAEDVRKCVMSAVANAENNHQLDVDSLIVAEAYVGKNLVMKRFAARGRGRGFRILKPFSQITVVVRETEAEEPKAKKGAAKKAAAKPAKKPAAKAAAAEKEAE
jgi:large subunit ribosomal protein L22